MPGRRGKPGAVPPGNFRGKIMKTVIDTLMKRGYKKYKSYKEYVILYQKKFPGKIVCDCNEAIYIDVEIFNHPALEYHTKIEIGLRAEKNGKWWDIKCYGLSEKEFVKSVASLEKKIIKAFEAIAGGR
jgi:hypothetical protein